MAKSTLHVPRLLSAACSFLFLTFILNAKAAPDPGRSEPQSDTVIVMSATEGTAYIERMLQAAELWRSDDHPLRYSLERLVDQYHVPYDSAARRLRTFPFDSVAFEPMEIAVYDSLPARWLNDSTVILGKTELEREPWKQVATPITRMKDTTMLAGDLTEFEVMVDTVLGIEGHEPRYVDTTVAVVDTILQTVIDTAYLDSLQLPLHTLQDGQFTPPLPLDTFLQLNWTPDSAFLVRSSSREVLTGAEGTPFFIVPGEYITDSLEAAVGAVASYTYERDSILVFLNDLTGSRQPFWLTSHYDELTRYWIKNRRNDSITIWVGNPTRNEISLLLEDDVNIRRMEKIEAEDIPITTLVPETSLAKVEPLKPIPVFWEYAFSSSFALNQTYLANWAKGGESSLATMLDIKGEAKYTDKSTKTEWKNNGRLKYGSIISGENGLRTNTDMVELNSQFNRVIRKEFDFSALFYMKNQLARGYNYPNDSVVVSKFLNPTTFTVGVGVEYKPFKKTVINFSPLSYKNTFVLDTAEIDQTNHGIDADKRARQEMGGQLLVKNELEVLDGLRMNNSLRLFSNYFDKPQNIDVDWEFGLEKRISWYASVAFNLHMIYDDNIRFPVMDDAGEPIELPDGSIRKAPKLQLKQFVGLTFALQF